MKEDGPSRPYSGQITIGDTATSLRDLMEQQGQNVPHGRAYATILHRVDTETSNVAYGDSGVEWGMGDYPDQGVELVPDVQTPLPGTDLDQTYLVCTVSAPPAVINYVVWS